MNNYGFFSVWFGLVLFALCVCVCLYITTFALTVHIMHQCISLMILFFYWSKCYGQGDSILFNTVVIKILFLYLHSEKQNKKTKQKQKKHLICNYSWQIIQGLGIFSSWTFSLLFVAIWGEYLKKKSTEVLAKVYTYIYMYSLPLMQSKTDFNWQESLHVITWHINIQFSLTVPPKHMARLRQLHIRRVYSQISVFLSLGYKAGFYRPLSVKYFSYGS